MSSDSLPFRVSRQMGKSIVSIQAIASLTMTQKAIAIERLMEHGRVDDRARRLIKSYIASPRVEFTQDECDHIVWCLGHLLEADDADRDSIAGAMIMMKYCIDGCCDDIRNRFLPLMVIEEL